MPRSAATDAHRSARSGTRRRPPARIGAVAWTSVAAFAAARRAVRLRPARSRPIFEHVEVFQRVGESHRRRAQGDVRLRRTRAAAARAATRGHRAGRARASCSTSRATPWKVWYLAPHFRYERPQKGRYRQHWQVGAEVLGVDDPDVDVEVIALAHGFYRGPRALARCALLAQLDGRRASRGPRTSRSLRDVPARPRRRARATSSASGSSRTRCGSSTRSATTGRT